MVAIKRSKEVEYCSNHKVNLIQSLVTKTEDPEYAVDHFKMITVISRDDFLSRDKLFTSLDCCMKKFGGLTVSRDINQSFKGA